MPIDLAVRKVNSCRAGAYWLFPGIGPRPRTSCAIWSVSSAFRVFPGAAGGHRPLVRGKGGCQIPSFQLRHHQKELDGNRGQPSNVDLQSGFSFASNTGSHPGFEGLAWHATESGKMIGPTAHPDRRRDQDASWMQEPATRGWRRAPGSKGGASSENPLEA